MNITKQLINNLKEYEYFLVNIDKDKFKIKFDSNKEFKNIKRIIDKVYFNKVKEFNALCFEYDNKYIYLILKELKKEVKE